jgi:hypothetical protein
MHPSIVLVHGASAESASWHDVAVDGASHAIADSQPGAVTELILEAARLPAAA